jgi:hypothetical protein
MSETGMTTTSSFMSTDRPLLAVVMVLSLMFEMAAPRVGAMTFA